MLRIQDVYPGSWFLLFIPPWSRIQQHQKMEKICCLFFFVATNLKLKLFYFWTGTNKNMSQFAKNYKYFLSKRIVICSQKYGFGIRCRKKPFPDPQHWTPNTYVVEVWFLPPRRAACRFSSIICRTLSVCWAPSTLKTMTTWQTTRMPFSSQLHIHIEWLSVVEP